MLDKKQIIKSVLGGILFISGYVLAGVSFEAFGDTDYSETSSGWDGYDYETGEFIEITKDPTGGWDGYSYGTREHFEIEESPSGGFTIYSDER